MLKCLLIIKTYICEWTLTTSLELFFNLDLSIFILVSSWIINISLSNTSSIWNQRKFICNTCSFFAWSKPTLTAHVLKGPNIYSHFQKSSIFSIFLWYTNGQTGCASYGAVSSVTHGQISNQCFSHRPVQLSFGQPILILDTLKFEILLLKR